MRTRGASAQALRPSQRNAALFELRDRHGIVVTLIADKLKINGASKGASCGVAKQNRGDVSMMAALGYPACPQPAGLWTRVVEAGYIASFAAGRRGRTTNSPPQFGQVFLNFVSAHEPQNVHSKVQMRASVESFGKSRLQHSQLGRSSSIRSPLWRVDA